MRTIGTVLVGLALALVAGPGCKKAKEKAKELMNRATCKKAQKVGKKCFPKLAERSMRTEKEKMDKCLETFKENIPHRVQTVKCMADTKGDCDKAKTCFKEALKAEMEYRKQKKKDKKSKKSK